MVVTARYMAAAQPQPALVSPQRRARGRTNHVSGMMAEDSVARRYEAQGMQVLARRWRGRSGEIDLVCRDGGCLVFVEVKKAASHADAALRLGAAQQRRICTAALEFCASRGLSTLTEMRFDAALVDGIGRVEIIENAFGDCLV